ncbi:MAG: FixH family protein [Gammaproteobacteria bacterium]|jgi:hypothetical protein
MDATATAPPPHTPSRANPALWAVIGIPAATVVASAVTLMMAYGGAEPELPERYAWEGAALDRDVARAARARALGLGAGLELRDDGRVVLQLIGPARGDPSPTADAAIGVAPRALTLHLTHATRAALDRSVTLTPTREFGRFEGRMGSALPAARWLVQLDDERGEWRLRGRLETPSDAMHLGH